jgi:ferredoxin
MPLLFAKSSTNIHTPRHEMAKTSPEQQLKSFVGVRQYLLLFSDSSLTEDVQKTPHNKFTFDSERDSQESEICRELGKDRRDCITVCGSCPDLCPTETTTPAEDGLQATIRVYAGSGILLCSAIRPLADSHGMHSYTKELRVIPFAKYPKA